MRIPTPHIWLPLGMCLSLPVASAEVVEAVKEPTGKAVQLAIDNCAARGGGVVCLPPGRLENITIANLRVKMLTEDRPDKRATDALIFHGIDGLTLRDVVVDWDRQKSEPKWGSALLLRDISNLALQGFQGQAARPEGPLPAIVESNITRQRTP